MNRSGKARRCHGCKLKHGPPMCPKDWGKGRHSDPLANVGYSSGFKATLSPISVVGPSLVISQGEVKL